jgi:Rrf2 family protein
MGRAGGYVLGRDPEDIRLKDIIEAAIGPIAITECVHDDVDCLHRDFCSCRGLWALINRRIVKDLEEFTLADLIDESWSRRVAEEFAKLE